MARTDLPVKAILVGFLLAAGLLVVLLSAVGFTEVLTELRAADPVFVPIIAGAALCWMAAWSCSLHLVSRSLGIRTPFRRSFLVYLNLLFTNNVAPFSVLGAEPIAALLVSRATDTSYERSLAVVTSVDVLNFLPAPALALLGLLYFGSTTILGRRAEVEMASLLGVFALLAAGGYVGWRRRDALSSTVAGALTTAGRYLPGVGSGGGPTIEARIDATVASLEQIAADRRTRRFGLLTSSAGWAFQSSVLWLSLAALAHSVPVEVPVFVVPLATVADVVPIPGGVGSVDAALVVLLVATTGIPAAAATAGVLLHRSATFLFPVVIGGAATAFTLGVGRRDPDGGPKD